MEVKQPEGSRQDDHFLLPRKPVFRNEWQSSSDRFVRESESADFLGQYGNQNDPGLSVVSARSQRTRWRSFVEYGWLVEITSCLISTVALFAIIITLLVHQGRPLPQWPHYISINALIAIFTAIFKTSMIMPVAEGISQLKWLWFRDPRALVEFDDLDQASRGPLGSMLLLARGPRYYLPLFGALISVVALAVDPFSQQILQYNECTEPEAALEAQVPRINSYTVSAYHVAAGETALDATMINALYTGMLNPPANATSSIPIDCRTGNCTFPADGGASYSSLAMCHTCVDISKEATKHPNREYPTLSNWTIPSGASVTEYNMSSTALPPAGPYVFAFENLMLSYRDCKYNATFGDICTTAPFAVRCAISPCVKTVGANVSNFVLQENTLSSTVVPLVYNGDYMLGTTRTLRDGRWHACNPAKEISASNPINVTVTAPYPNFDAIKSFSYYPEDCVWRFGAESQQAISGYLHSLLIDQHVTAGTYGSTDPSLTAGPAWLVRMYRNGTADMETVNEWMAGLSNAITATMRQRGDSQSQPARGTVYRLQTCIGVQWAWISLPASLLLLTLGFLAITCSQTHTIQGQKMIWKSSTLATLFHGLQDDLRYVQAPLSKKAEMEGTASNLHVQLQTVDGQVKLCRTR